MGKATGFLEYERVDGPVVAEADRVKDFHEFHKSLPIEEQKKQAADWYSCLENPMDRGTW